MPRTTLPQFPLDGMTKVFKALCAQLPAGKASNHKFFSSALARCLKRISEPVGLHRTAASFDGSEVLSDVDELYRVALGLESSTTWPGANYAKGWTVSTVDGVRRLAAYGTKDGKRSAFVRIPKQGIAVIILTNDKDANARKLSQRILHQLLLGSS
jgi:hypothetical protein